MSNSRELLTRRRTWYFWVIRPFMLLTGPLFQIKLHLLGTVLLSGFQSSLRAGKFHGSGEHSIRNCLQHRDNFHRSRAWRIVPILCTAIPQDCAWSQGKYSIHSILKRSPEHGSSYYVNRIGSSDGVVISHYCAPSWSWCPLVLIMICVLGTEYSFI